MEITRYCMDETINIRELKVGDFERALNMFSDRSKLVGLDRVDPILGETVPEKITASFGFDRFSNLYKEIINGDAIAVVAESNDKIVGLCYAVGGKWPEADHVAELRSPIIEREYFNTNTGEEMIKKIKEKSKGRFEIISMVISTTDEEALKKLESEYAEQLGFVRWGLAPKFYKKDGKYYPLVFEYLNV